jgi:hypothetical protein
MVLFALLLFLAGCDSEQVPEQADCPLDCGIHGSCLGFGSNSRCNCAIGWDGEYCEACAPGFVSNLNECVHDPDAGTQDPDASVEGCADGLMGPVLFIGNSYTSANSLPSLIAGFSEANSCPLDYEATMPGGYRFLDHATNASTQNLMRSRSWAAIVLQNQSQVPAWRPEDVTNESLPHARALALIARENEPHPRLVYFMTWGRLNGDSDNCNYYDLVCTFEGQTQALHDGYSLYADETAGELSPVGLAWAAVHLDETAPFPYEQLWTGDNSHPTLLGSYLAAAVLYYTLSGNSPVGTSYTAGLSSEYAAYLVNIAASTVETATRTKKTHNFGNFFIQWSYDTDRIATTGHNQVTLNSGK